MVQTCDYRPFSLQMEQFVPVQPLQLKQIKASNIVLLLPFKCKCVNLNRIILILLFNDHMYEHNYLRIAYLSVFLIFCIN